MIDVLQRTGLTFGRDIGDFQSTSRSIGLVQQRPDSSFYGRCNQIADQEVLREGVHAAVKERGLLFAQTSDQVPVHDIRRSQHVLSQ